MLASCPKSGLSVQKSGNGYYVSYGFEADIDRLLVHKVTDDNSTDHKEDRRNDSKKILNSTHPRKVVLAGPGTGKSHLFKKAIEKVKKQGKHNILAITFVGKLSDELADDLAGLAETMTLHGFAKRFVQSHCSDEWKYYPDMSDVIKQDVAIKGNANCEVGDTDYEERTKYYKAIGHNDVVHYAVQICRKDKTKIPKYDLILVDEFQDFNETEAQFIDLLAKENELLIVGDDDQALYLFKGSKTKFIREKFNAANTQFESHTLKYCSRCTEVIINAFHSVVEHFCDRGKLRERENKEYVFYPPDKAEDSALNPKILLHEEIGPGGIPILVKNELEEILKNQKIKSVLVLGEPQTCQDLLKSTARKLRELGFTNVRHPDQHNNTYSLQKRAVAGYKMLSKQSDDSLGWRLLIDCLNDENQKRDIISAHYSDSAGFIDAIPDDFKKAVGWNCRTFKNILTNPPSKRGKIAPSSIDKLAKAIVENEKEPRDVFINQLLEEKNYLDRPLANLSITVCSILGAKGLSADVVFLIGFDQGKLPRGTSVDDSEIYQLLVALTRARKRFYLINTMGHRVSQFIDCIDKDCIGKA